MILLDQTVGFMLQGAFRIVRNNKRKNSILTEKELNERSTHPKSLAMWFSTTSGFDQADSSDAQKC